MTPALLSLLLPVLKSAVNKAAPDKPQADQILTRLEDELTRLLEPRENDMLKHQMLIEAQAAQAAITTAEAAHQSVFVAGWRPMCGWACSLAVVWLFFGAPVMAAVTAALGLDIPEHLMFELLFALLGLAGLRSFDKLKGLSRYEVPQPGSAT